VAPTGGPAIGKTQWRTLAEIFDRKWSVFVLLILRKQTKRFKALQRALHGVSQKVLTATLRSLERDGLVSRTIYPTVPPKVEYALTDLGCKLAGHLATIGSFAAANGQRIEAVREQFDRKAAPRSDEPSMTQAPGMAPRP
jgi:DNA-binding HxlR family transcriptional regulator